jgi:hypothetical protein
MITSPNIVFVWFDFSRVTLTEHTGLREAHATRGSPLLPVSGRRHPAGMTPEHACHLIDCHLQIKERESAAGFVFLFLFFLRSTLFFFFFFFFSKIQTCFGIV